MSTTDRDVQPAPSFLVCAAEASGDQHAAHLVRAVRELRPDATFEAFGGDALRKAGCHLHDDPTDAAAMAFGFLSNFMRYVRLLRTFDRVLAERPPTAVVLVDSPGLNFLLARLARWRGVPVVYYICPQIWAWAPWRRSKVLAWTDFLMPILPFEEAMYGGGDVPVRFAGHPLADEMVEYPPDAGERLRERLGLTPDRKLIGIFPGSRRQEVESLTRVFCRLVQSASQGIEAPHVAISAATDALRPLVKEASGDLDVPVEVVTGDAHPLMMACDFAVVASGTASLELAYFETPMMVLYRASRLGRFFFRQFTVTPYIALPNILGAAVNGDEPTVRELLFTRDPVDALVAEARDLIAEGAARDRALTRLRRLKESVFKPGGVAQAARTLLSFVDGKCGLGGGAVDVPASK